MSNNVYNIKTGAKVNSLVSIDKKNNLDELFMTNYWGYKITYRLAILPVHTQDFGWVWLIKCFFFRTTTGNAKLGWRWESQGATLSYSAMARLKDRFIHQQAAKLS